MLASAGQIQPDAIMNARNRINIIVLQWKTLAAGDTINHCVQPTYVVSNIKKVVRQLLPEGSGSAGGSGGVKDDDRSLVEMSE